MAKITETFNCKNHIHNAEIPPNQCKFLKFSIKIEMALIPIEGMKTLYSGKLQKPNFNWNLKITNTLAKKLQKQFLWLNML